jgi:hypothetical protein
MTPELRAAPDAVHPSGVTRRHHVPRLATLLLCALMVGCGSFTSSTSHRAWTREDSWYRAPPAGTQLWEWSELDGDRVHEVVEQSLPSAETLLKDVPCVVLDDQQARTFTGEPVPDVPGARAYLTRGVLLNRETGGFTIYVSGDQLIVYHRCLGRSTAPMSRQPLVLLLERKPSEIYVACSMAE